MRSSLVFCVVAAVLAAAHAKGEVEHAKKLKPQVGGGCYGPSGQCQVL